MYIPILVADINALAFLRTARRLPDPRDTDHMLRGAVVGAARGQRCPVFMQAVEPSRLVPVSLSRTGSSLPEINILHLSPNIYFEKRAGRNMIKAIPV